MRRGEGLEDNKMEEKRQKERLHYETDGDSDESKRTHNTSAAAAARNRFVVIGLLLCCSFFPPSFFMLIRCELPDDRTFKVESQLSTLFASFFSSKSWSVRIQCVVCMIP